MTVQKKRFNILDLAICLAVICSICLIFFRETVSEIFEEPQMVTLEVTVDFRGTEMIEAFNHTQSKTVAFEPEGKESDFIELDIGKITITQGNVVAPERAQVTFRFVGYKRLGRYYTELGERVYENCDCAFTLDGVRCEGYAVSVKKAETNT